MYGELLLCRAVTYNKLQICRAVPEGWLNLCRAATYGGLQSLLLSGHVWRAPAFAVERPRMAGSSLLLLSAPRMAGSSLCC